MGTVSRHQQLRLPLPNNLIVSDNNSLNVYSATRTGVWRSLDGGASWTKVLNGTFVNGCMDLDARTDTATDYVFAACGTFTQSTIYRNTDAGASGVWTSVYTEAGMGRTTLAIAPSNPNVIYALSASIAGGTFQDGLHAVFRSTSSGDAGTWTAQVRNTSPTPLNRLLLSNTVYGSYNACFGGGVNYYYNQGWYDNVIAVDPVDSNRVWVGGVDVFRSTDGGANWGVASRWWAGGPAFDHADQHGIVFHPDYNGTTNQTMYSLNDGGLYRTTNAVSGTTSTSTAPGSFICGGATPAGMVNWTELNNNYGVTQFYNGVPYPDGMSYFGGTQDNGTVRGTDAGGIDGWSMIHGGDGGYVAVNSTNTNILYAEYTGISIEKSTNGGATWTSATSGISDSGLFINPFVMDPSNSDTLWTGGSFPWRTTNAAGLWARAGTSFGSNVSAIAVANINSNRVVMGTTSGSIRRTTTALTANSGTVWASTTPRAGYVSSVAFDPSNEMLVYATYSTFGGFHVWRSTDGGATFSSIDGAGATGIPDIPAHSIVVDPSNSARLYVGTDLGVFVSRDTGATWAVENTGFANVITETLAVGNVSGVPHIFAFTHGRGTFRVPPVDSDGLPTVTISATDETATEAGPTTGTYTVSRTGSTASALTVFYSESGTATSGSDYTALSGSVTIAAGSSSSPVVVSPIDDALVESDETVIATLSANAAYTVGAPSSATITVVSDDVLPTVTIAATDATATEAGPTTGTYAVSRTGSTASALTVFYAVSGTATSGSDYTALSGSVTIAAAASSAPIVVTPIDDALVESDETVIATLSANAAYTVGASSSATVTIVSDDTAALPDLSISLVKPPTAGGAGLAINVKDTTLNTAGAGAAPATSTGLYLSANNVWDAGDVLLGSRAVPALAPGASSTATTIVTIPGGTATGKWFIIARADNGTAAAESNEGNNTRAKVIYIGPDLSITKLVGPASATRGTTVLLDLTTTNVGGAAIGESTTRIYLSTDATVGATDDELGTINVPALASGGNHVVTGFSVTIPAGTATGSRYFLAVADDLKIRVEANEKNLRKRAVTINP